MKKRPIILWEALIALSLTALLLTLLLSFFVQNQRAERKLEQTRQAVASHAYIQTHLQTLLSATFQEPSSFYTKEDALIFLFDHGIDPDPAYSGKVAGRLFIDANHNLSLSITPLGYEGKGTREEKLLPHVDLIEFAFLGKVGAPEPHEKVTPINNQLAWRSLWSKSQIEPPSMIRLILHQKKELIPFAFFLPKEDPLVTYIEPL